LTFKLSFNSIISNPAPNSHFNVLVSNTIAAKRQIVFPLPVPRPPCEQGEAGASSGNGKEKLTSVISVPLW
jgi:hypothetical protein